MSSISTRLLLVRHGQTSWNAAGRWQGHANPGLTEEGKQQARHVARDLAAGVDRPWTRIFASDLARARETAVVIAEALSLEIQSDRRLRELDVGAWSGLTRTEIAARDLDRLLAFERGDPLIRPGGGESRVEIRERAHEFASDLASRWAGEHVIVVTHRGVMRALHPGAEPNNAEGIEVVAEEIVARGVDRSRRPEDGAL